MSPHTRRFRWVSLVLLLSSAGQATAQSPAADGPKLGPPAGPLPALPASLPAGPASPVLPEGALRKEAEQPGAFTLSADYLLLTARSRPLDYAIVGPSNAFGPQGDVRSLSWDTASGFRAGGGYRLPGEGWEVGAYYTYFHTSASSSAAAGPADTLYPTLTHPGVVEIASSGVATGKINYNIGDVEISKRFQPSEALQVRAFAGPRFADVDQEINVLYNGGDAVNDRVRSRINFEGGGFRAGAEATWSLGKDLGVYARGGASLLTGSFVSTLTETTNNGAVSVVNVTDRFHKVVPVIEMGLGVNWTYRNWRVSAGYELVNWFGLVDGPDFVDDSAPGKMSHRVGDLSLEGLVLRAQLEF